MLNGDRRDLGFAGAATAAFVFLEGQYSLHRVEIGAMRVRYEDERVFLNVYRGRSSYELDLELGRKAMPSEAAHPYTMSEMIGVTDEPEGRQYRRYVADRRDLVGSGLNRLADDFRRYGIRGVTGDDAFFQEPEPAKRRAAERRFAEIDLSQIRRRAELAWHARSYPKVQGLYESIADQLSALERARLAYARRHRDR